MIYSLESVCFRDLLSKTAFIYLKWDLLLLFFLTGVNQTLIIILLVYFLFNNVFNPIFLLNQNS